MTPRVVRPVTAKPPPREARKRPRTLVNVFSGYGVVLFGAVSAFFLSPFVVHKLGNEAYGTWVLLVSLVGYLGLLDIGVRGAVTRFIAHRHAADDHAASSRYASAGLFLFSITAAITIIVGAGIALGIGRIFNISPELIDTAQVAVFLGAVTMAVAFVGGVYGGIVTGMERFDINAVTEICVQIFRIVAIVLALNAGYELVALASIQLTGGLLILGTNVLLSRWLYPELDMSLRRWTRTDLREILDFSIVTTILRGAGLITLQLDAAVIGMFHPAGLIAYFAVGSNLIVYARSMLDAIAHTITPRISALEGGGELAHAHRLPLVGGRIGALVLLPIIMTFLTRGSTFIGLWMGEEYAGPSGQVLWILALGLWALAGRGVLGAAFLGLNRHRALLAPLGIEAALNLGLSLLWVRSFGIVGVAWGTTVPALLANGAMLPLVYSRVLKTTLRQIYVDLVIRPTVAVVPFALASIAVERLLTVSSVSMFFVQVTMILPLALLGAWHLGLTHRERALFGARLPKPLLRVLALGRELR